MVHLGVRANCLKNKVIFILARLPKPISFWFGVDDNWEKAHSSLGGWSSFRLPSIPEIVDFLIKLQIATFKCVLYFNFSTFWGQNLQFYDMETDINCAENCDRNGFAIASRNHDAFYAVIVNCMPGWNFERFTQLPCTSLQIIIESLIRRGWRGIGEADLAGLILIANWYIEIICSFLKLDCLLGAFNSSDYDFWQPVCTIKLGQRWLNTKRKKATSTQLTLD